MKDQKTNVLGIIWEKTMQGKLNWVLTGPDEYMASLIVVPRTIQ
jgi:hypothetical protein